MGKILVILAVVTVVTRDICIAKAKCLYLDVLLLLGWVRGWFYLGTGRDQHLISGVPRIPNANSKFILYRRPMTQVIAREGVPNAYKSPYIHTHFM